MTTVRTLTPDKRRASALRSTVTLKAAMAGSGLIMVLYLLAHMYGNLRVFSGRRAFDDYAHHLRTAQTADGQDLDIAWDAQLVRGLPAACVWRSSTCAAVHCQLHQVG